MQSTAFLKKDIFKHIQKWFSCFFWAQCRENLEKFMFCLIIANKVVRVACAPGICCIVLCLLLFYSWNQIIMFISTAATVLGKGGKNNNKVFVKQTRWPSASWTFPKINEFISWEADTENRCSQRNHHALFFLLQCAHMKYFFFSF